MDRFQGAQHWLTAHWAAWRKESQNGEDKGYRRAPTTSQPSSCFPARPQGLEEGPLRWSGVDPWAASLRGGSRAHRDWATCSRPGLPGAHVQAPGQTSDTQTHHLKWKHLFLGIWNLPF